MPADETEPRILRVITLEDGETVHNAFFDLDAKGEVVGLDIDHASKKLDLSVVETVALPPASAAE